MGSGLSKKVQIQANLNGRELSAEGVANLLNVLFGEGWLDDVLKTALGVQAAGMERARLDIKSHMQRLKQTLEQAANVREGAPTQSAGEPELGEGTSS